VTERLLARLRALPDVEEAPSQWTGGPAFWIDGREFVHLHGEAVEVRVTRRLVDRALEDERVVRRTRTSDWVVIPAAEEELIVELAKLAAEVNRR
jgi:hypothetical protein